MKKIIVIAIIASLIGNLNSAKAQSSAEIGGFKLWYEFGNGEFINTSFITEDSILNYFNIGLPANNGNSSGPLFAIKKTTPIYIPLPPPPPPPIKYIAYQPTDDILPNSYATTPMPDGQILHLQTSTRDFLSKDTLMLAINYTKPANANKVALFYNSNPNAIFNPITTINSATYYPNTISDDSMALPNIRMYNGEIASVAPSAMYNTGKPGNGYQDGLIFTTNSSTTNNIFLTLYTFPTIVTTANERFRLVFLDENNQIVNKETRFDLINNSKLKSHDPNNELTNPECLEIGKIPPNKIIRYHVNFQNIGLGHADSVKTTTILPAGYTTADLMTTNANLEWKIADRFQNNIYTATIKPTTNPNHLYIEFRKKTKTAVLRGTLGLPNPLSDVNTMGEFDFDLKLHAGIASEANLASYTSIVFDDNAPVLTDSATIRIRTCCTCRERGDESNDSLRAKKKCCNKLNLKKWQQWLFCKDCD